MYNINSYGERNLTQFLLCTSGRISVSGIQVLVIRLQIRIGTAKTHFPHSIIYSLDPPIASKLPPLKDEKRRIVLFLKLIGGNVEILGLKMHFPSSVPAPDYQKLSTLVPLSLLCYIYLYKYGLQTLLQGLHYHFESRGAATTNKLF